MLNKILFINIILLSFILGTFAQSPNLINYQGVARQSNGTPINNQLIVIRLSVHDATSNGTIQYSETRNVTTDAEGLFNIQIGSVGTSSTTGLWSSITWENAAKYLQVEMDATGGNSFINMGTQQLVSVPYAQHAKQAASLTPTATINPNQITSGGASVNNILQFDGSNWIPSAIAPGSLALPYNVADPNLVSFAVTNTSAFGGRAITGQTTVNHINATGVLGEATAASIQGTGVHGKGNSASSIGVKGSNTTGIAIKGSTATTSSSTPAVFGECTGTTGIGVKGNSNGAANTSIGVYGESSNGTGVKGYGNNVGSVAVYGSALAGTGVMAYSFTGTALDVIGKTELDGNLKISGGSTNPSAGAVLTSDASGNATWKNNRVAFGARGINNSYTVMPDNVFQKVEFNVEDYDLAGNFVPSTGTSNSNTSVFTVPVSGVYNINSKLVVWIGSSFTNMSFTEIRVRRLRAGTTSTLLRSDGYVNTNSSYDHSEPSIISDFHFLAGDKVWIEIRQANDDNDPANLGSSADEDDVWFRASLIIPD